MNLNKIFSLFIPSTPTKSSKEIIKPNDTLMAEYCIRMYEKVLENFSVSGKEFLKNLKKDPDFNLVDIKDIEAAGQYMIYNMAWGYISNINIQNVEHCKTLEKYKNTQLTKYIKMGIKHFETNEEYERCAHLKKILNKLENI